MKKYMKDFYSIKGSNMKKALLYIFLLNILLSAVSLKKIWIENNSEQNEPKRNLQYALNSIYYNIAYPANDITGTGDKLKDVPYKVLCKILSCVSSCCVGEIDNMRCGATADCKVYSDYAKVPGMIAAIVVPIGVFILLVALCYYLVKYRKYTFCSAFCMCLGCVFILTIPIVLYYLLCKKENNVTSKNNKESIHDDNLLLVNNKDAEANTLKNEPEKLLINHNLQNKRYKEQINAGSGAALDRSGHQSHQEYKKLSSEDHEHKQMIGIGQTDLYAEKMKIRIPDPTFDDNFLNEKSHNSVRVNSIHHKLKEEDGIDQNNQNGQHHSFENNKEAEDEDFKNRTRSERDELIGGNLENDREDLLAMGEENVDNYTNNDDNKEKDIEEMDKEGEEANGEQATPENGDANAEENNDNNDNNDNNEYKNDSQENANVDNGEANAEGNNEDNENIEMEAENGEQVIEANNEDNNGEGGSGEKAETPVENAEVDNQIEENNADKPAENAEGEAIQIPDGDQEKEEKAEGEANAEVVEANPEGEVQPENPENSPVDNPENIEASAQE